MRTLFTSFAKCLLPSLVLMLATSALAAAEMATGFKIGEVTQDSAIVWTRISAKAERNWDGYRDPKKREPYVDEYVPSKIAVADREGSTPGAAGQVRVTYGEQQTKWVNVRPEDDFTHQFHLHQLTPDTRYTVKVEARQDDQSPVSSSLSGSFRTAASKEQWQDARFAVVTGQSYWDLDDKQGYHMYPAMQKQNLDFLVPTGDTVYLDSESPGHAPWTWPDCIGSGCTRSLGMSNSTGLCLATGKWTTTTRGSTIAGQPCRPSG